MSSCVGTYAYNLLGNHFHLLIKIRNEKELKGFQIKNKIAEGKSTHDIVSHQFRKFFQSYALAFNKQHDRIGTLFQKPFKRALIDNDTYLQNTLTYIHKNAQHHDLVTDFRDWEWSSYHAYLSEMPSNICRKDVIRLFKNSDRFINKHSKQVTAAAFTEIEW